MSSRRALLLLTATLAACTADPDPVDLGTDAQVVLADATDPSTDAGESILDSGIADAGIAAPDAATLVDGGALPDATASTDSGAVEADGGERDRWQRVDRIVRQAVASEQISGLGLAVYDANDQLVFQQVYGDFAPDRQVAVASASKLPAAMVLLDLVAGGALALDDTTGAVLGWTGPAAAITLRHLLSFTSGLPPNALCTNNRRITLAECVDTIATSTLAAAPGTRFDYGGTHLTVAARMAEVRAGRTWNELFRAHLADPLGLPADVVYYTNPRNSAGTTNPLVGGGLRASMDDYARILALAFHRGRFDGVTVATRALFDEQSREPFPAAVIGNSPMMSVGQPYRYGLGCWLECATPAAGCDVISSPGAFGWTPWLDRDSGYYAILGMELSGVDGGVVAFSVNLEQTLKPEIIRALRP